MPIYHLRSKWRRLTFRSALDSTSRNDLTVVNKVVNSKFKYFRLHRPVSHTVYILCVLKCSLKKASCSTLEKREVRGKCPQKVGVKLNSRNFLQLFVRINAGIPQEGKNM